MKQIFTLLISTIIILTINYSVYAQKGVKEIKLKEIQGIAIGSENESIEHVIQKAVNKAKYNALIKAGVEENIASFTNYFQSENNEEYDELFTSDILSDIRGAVKNVEIVSKNKTFKDDSFFQVEVIINCIVVKYLVEKDISFDIWIDGVGMFYPNETNLIFDVKTSKDAYVKIFIFSETEAYQLFPNDYEMSYLLKANIINRFPSNTLDYTLFTEKKAEVHRMIMVFMKEDIPFTDDVEYKKIIDWIFSIPPNMRVIKSFGFSVVNEDKMKEE